MADRVEMILGVLPIAALSSGVDSVYAAIRTRLEQAGTPIGGNDLLIAAHAMSLNASVVTANESEFRRVRGLAVENWL